MPLVQAIPIPIMTRRPRRTARRRRHVVAAARVTIMSTGAADMTRIRSAIGAELDEFIGQQRHNLAAISADLLPCVIAIGDLLLAWTDEMLRASGLAPAAVWRGLRVLDAMRTEVFSGQFLDVVAQASGASDAASALRVVTYKSAKYTVERPLHLGAELAGAEHRATLGASGRDGAAAPGGGPGRRRAFTDYGIPIGTAFQLRDDILGVFGDPVRTG